MTHFGASLGGGGGMSAILEKNDGCLNFCWKSADSSFVTPPHMSVHANCSLEMLRHSKFHSLLLCEMDFNQRRNLRAPATNAAGKEHVLWHDGHSLGVDSTELRVFEKPNKKGLACLLQRVHGRRLHSKLGLQFLNNFTDEALKGKLLKIKTDALSSTITTL